MTAGLSLQTRRAVLEHMECCLPPLTGGVFDIGNKETENVGKQASKQNEERLLLNKGGRNQQEAK